MMYCEWTTDDCPDGKMRCIHVGCNRGLVKYKNNHVRRCGLDNNIKQPKEVVKNNIPEPSINKPGDILKWVIWHLTGEIPCSECNARARQMNEWGWIGCVIERRTIIGWLVHEAQKRGHRITNGGELLDLALEVYKKRG